MKRTVFHVIIKEAILITGEVGMGANVDGMIRAAVEAFRAGNKGDARTLLEKALELEEYNETAWLWLSSVVDTPEEQRTCLENVLVINPNNERAIQGLKSLGIDPSANRPAAAGAAFAGTPAFSDTSDLFGDADFGGGAVAGGASVWDDDALPTSSASSRNAPPGPGKDDFDAMIGSLGLGGSDLRPSAPPPKPAPSGSASLFGIDDGDLESMFGSDIEEEEDIYAQQAAPAFEATAAAFEADAVDDFELLTDVADDSMAYLVDPNAVSLDTEQFSPLAAMFAIIPDEIEPADRLPGEDEAAPRGLLIGIGVMALLNVLALLLLLLG